MADMLKSIIAVGCGGFFGSVLRFLTGKACAYFFGTLKVPMGTLVVNLVGCFCIGLLAGATQGKLQLSENTKLFVMTGILGGFTTFSAFGLDNFELFKSGNMTSAMINILIQIVLGIILVAAGFWLAGKMAG